jgi:hypothetical protein
MASRAVDEVIRDFKDAKDVQHTVEDDFICDLLTLECQKWLASFARRKLLSIKTRVGMQRMEAEVQNLTIMVARKRGTYCTRAAAGASTAELRQLARVRLQSFWHEDEPWRSVVGTPKNFPWARLHSKDPKLIEVCVPSYLRGWRRSLVWNAIAGCPAVNTVRICGVLLKRFRCKDLDFSRNNFCSVGIRSIVGLLEVFGGSISSLDLQVDDLKSLDGRRIASVIVNSCHNLEKINGLMPVCIMDVGSQGLCLSNGFLQGLTSGLIAARPKHFDFLNFGSCFLGPTGIAELAGAIRKQTTLQSLDLSFNSLGSFGIRHLPRIFECISQLKNLNLKSNLIGSGGSCVLASSLPLLQHLHKLDISHNDLSTAGAFRLASTISNLTSLQELDLTANHLGAAGANVVIKELASLENFLVLNLSCNRIGSAGVAAIAIQIGRLKNLRVLETGGNGFCSAQDELLASLLLRKINIDPDMASEELICSPTGPNSRECTEPNCRNVGTEYVAEGPASFIEPALISPRTLSCCVPQKPAGYSIMQEDEDISEQIAKAAVQSFARKVAAAVVRLSELELAAV